MKPKLHSVPKYAWQSKALTPALYTIDGTLNVSSAVQRDRDVRGAVLDMGFAERIRDQAVLRHRE